LHKGKIVRRRVVSAAAVAAFVMLGAGPAPAIELSHALAQMYSDLSVPPPTAEQMMVCYGFGCRRRMFLEFTDADRKRLTEILATGRASPEAERKAVQQAVVWFDRRVGPIIGTSKRVARADFRYFDAAHNFDCFDTTRNAASLLLVMQEWGLFRHHTVGDPRYRGNFLVGQTPHNTAVLIERASRRGWVVDMWPRGYAELPDVMTVEQWLTEN
jgi:hypothetical protein